MKGSKKQKKEEFQYLSEKRIQEVHQIFETFQKTGWGYPNQKAFNYISNAPFKKLSVLKQIPLKIISTS